MTKPALSSALGIERHRRSNVSAASLVMPLVATTLSLWPASGCSRSESPKADPSFLEFVSLRAAPDATHTIPVADRGGKAWYREATPCLDLRDVELDHASVSEFAKGNYAVMAKVRPSRVAVLAEWSRARAGHPVGWMLDGRLHYHDELKSEMRYFVPIPGFATEADAVDALRKLKDVARSLKN